MPMSNDKNIQSVENIFFIEEELQATGINK